jgi:Spy/CpxP family protein refolding chaperone
LKSSSSHGGWYTSKQENMIDMKTDKHIVLVVLALGSLLSFGPAACAQNQTNSPPANGQRGARLREHFAKVAQELKLTDEQKSKVRAVFREERERFQVLRADTSLTPAQRRAQVKQIRDDINASMRGILTAGQYEKWREMREERKESRQARRQDKQQGNTNQN